MYTGEVCLVEEGELGHPPLLLLLLHPQVDG